MNRQPQITKKRVFLALLLLFALWGLYYVFTHSILTIKGVGDEEKFIYIERSEDDVKLENFSLTNNSETFILPRGSYVINVNGENKQSLYEKSLGGASRHSVD